MERRRTIKFLIKMHVKGIIVGITLITHIQETEDMAERHSKPTDWAKEEEGETAGHVLTVADMAI